MMKLNNKKGFTLIELLAVIVILAILLAIAIPSVSKYINTAKKNTYIVNVKEYADAAQKELNLVDSDFIAPVNQGDALVITFEELKTTLENGGKTSSYGAEFEEAYSYVVVVNEGTADKPRYGYYVAALDTKGYGIGDSEGTKVIRSDELKEANVVQVGKGNGVPTSNISSKLVGKPDGLNVNNIRTNSSSNTNSNTNGG